MHDHVMSFINSANISSDYWIERLGSLENDKNVVLHSTWWMNDYII